MTYTKQQWQAAFKQADNADWKISADYAEAHPELGMLAEVYDEAMQDADQVQATIHAAAIKWEDNWDLEQMLTMGRAFVNTHDRWGELLQDHLDGEFNGYKLENVAEHYIEELKNDLQGPNEIFICSKTYDFGEQLPVYQFDLS